MRLSTHAFGRLLQALCDPSAWLRDVIFERWPGWWRGLNEVATHVPLPKSTHVVCPVSVGGPASVTGPGTKRMSLWTWGGAVLAGLCAGGAAWLGPRCKWIAEGAAALILLPLFTVDFQREIRMVLGCSQKYNKNSRMDFVANLN